MKQHPYYKDLYVTTDGKVFRQKGESFIELKQTTTTFGYLDITVKHQGKYLRKRVHRIVAETYLSNPDGLREVDHLDCDKKNNSVDNLEWVSSKENKRRAHENGLYDSNKGANHHNAVLSEDVVHKICQCIQDGMRNIDICKLFSVSKHNVAHIKNGNLWKEISQHYSFDVKRNKRKSADFIKQVCIKIAQGLSDCDIAKDFQNKITLQDIRRIRAKTIHKQISDSYF